MWGWHCARSRCVGRIPALFPEAMLCSVVTPTRNCLQYVKRCVGSVRGQRGAAYEHIFKDADSTDGTKEWLTRQKDLRVLSGRDGGMYDAINQGWCVAKGDILSWLNADEQYLPGTLERVTEIFARRPELDFVYGDVIVVDTSGRPIAARREIPLRSLYIRNSFLNAYSCGMFFRRRLLDSGDLRLDTSYRYAADMDLILRLLKGRSTYLHVAEYWSLFGVDGNNLSTHSGMAAETNRIYREFGGFRSHALRRAVVLLRYAERLVSGSYLSRTVRYRYAVDEAPNYILVEQKWIGGRYRIPEAH